MIEAAVAGDAFIRVVDPIDLHEEDKTDSNSRTKLLRRFMTTRFLNRDARYDHLTPRMMYSSRLRTPPLQGGVDTTKRWYMSVTTYTSSDGRGPP